MKKMPFLWLAGGLALAAPLRSRAQAQESRSPPDWPRDLYRVEKLTLEAKPESNDPELRQLRVRFRLNPEAPAPNFDENRRIGLLYLDPQGLLVPIQRGDMGSCQDDVCEALMDDNFLLRDYEASLGVPGRWAVVPLQNTRLVERQLELSKGRNKDKGTGGSFVMRVEAQYASLRVNETPNPDFFNYAKSSRLTTWGPQFSGLISWRGLTFLGSMESNVLSTTDYFDDARTTSTSEQSLGLGWTLNWGAFQFTPALFHFSRSFDTDNFDEAIISTGSKAFGLELLSSAMLPYFMNGGPDSGFRIGLGRFRLRLRQSFAGSAMDTGTLRRGDKGSHFYRSAWLGYEIYTRARNKIWDGWALGVGFGLNSSEFRFSGPTAGAIAAPEGSSATESWRSWRFTFAREVSF